MASSRRRITNLSWAWISASGGGATFTPSATSFSSSSVGTCSWSKVNTSAPSAARRNASRSVCAPITTSGVTCAAGSSGWAASTRSVWPSAIAAWCVILASCPPPTMVTSGGVVLVVGTAFMVSWLYRP